MSDFKQYSAYSDEPVTYSDSTNLGPCMYCDKPVALGTQAPHAAHQSCDQLAREESEVYAKERTDDCLVARAARADQAERERDAALERESRLRSWIVSFRQPHPESCDAWGWADPFGDEAMAYCSCGLRRAIAKANHSEPTEGTPEDRHE